MKLRISTILFLIMAGAAGFFLFQTSQDVQVKERELSGMKQAIQKEKESIRVLEAEWDYLNRPDRLEELARQHLKMVPAEPEILVKDSGDIPQGGVPVIPKTKPAQKIVPAVMHVEKAEPETPPMPAPLTNDNRMQFNDLLETLTAQEPAGGGAP